MMSLLQLHYDHCARSLPNYECVMLVALFTVEKAYKCCCRYAWTHRLCSRHLSNTSVSPCPNKHSFAFVRIHYSCFFRFFFFIWKWILFLLLISVLNGMLNASLLLWRCCSAWVILFVLPRYSISMPSKTEILHEVKENYHLHLLAFKCTLKWISNECASETQINNVLRAFWKKMQSFEEWKGACDTLNHERAGYIHPMQPMSEGKIIAAETFNKRINYLHQFKWLLHSIFVTRSTDASVSPFAYAVPSTSEVNANTDAMLCRLGCFEFACDKTVNLWSSKIGISKKQIMQSVQWFKIDNFVTRCVMSISGGHNNIIGWAQ